MFNFAELSWLDEMALLEKKNKKYKSFINTKTDLYRGKNPICAVIREGIAIKGNLRINTLYEMDTICWSEDRSIFNKKLSENSK